MFCSIIGQSEAFRHIVTELNLEGQKSTQSEEICQEYFLIAGRSRDSIIASVSSLSDRGKFLWKGPPRLNSTSKRNLSQWGRDGRHCLHKLCWEPGEEMGILSMASPERSIKCHHPK